MRQQPGCKGDRAPEGSVQFTRPDLSSRLSPARLCHCSFSSLAECPTPEEKNKKDGAPALPGRVKSLSVTMGTPPSPDPPWDDFISPSSRRAASPGWHGAGGHVHHTHGLLQLWRGIQGRTPQSSRLSSPGEGPTEDGGKVCTHTAYRQRNNDGGLSELQLLAENLSAPLHPSSLPSRREERRFLSLSAPPHLREPPAWDRGDLIPLHPPQQSWGKVTCESLPRVRGRNRRYLRSHVIGAPAKCCTSGTAVNKAGEAREAQQGAARGSRDLQPRSRLVGGRGGNPRRTATWSPGAWGSSTLTQRLFLEAPWHARASSVPGEQRQTLATDVLPAAGLCWLLQPLEPLLTKPSVRGPSPTHCVRGQFSLHRSLPGNHILPVSSVAPSPFLNGYEHYSRAMQPQRRGRGTGACESAQC